MRFWIAVSLLAGLVAGTAVVVVATLLDDTEERYGSALGLGETALTETSEKAIAARNLNDLRGVGESASLALARLEEQSHGVMDEQVRGGRAARAMLQAEHALLGAFASLQEVDESQFRQWGDVTERLRQATLDIDTATHSLDETKWASLAPAVPIVQRATEETDALMRRGKRRLVRWRRALGAARRKRGNDLSVIRSYATSMQSYLREYSSLRSEMQTFIDEVESTGVSFEEAYDTLDSAHAGRVRIREGIAALDAPTKLAKAHNGLFAVLNQSIAAIDAAIDGTVDLEFGNAHRDYREASGWRRFAEASDRIAGEFAAAQDQWQSLVDRTEDAIKQRSLPKKPKL